MNNHWREKISYFTAATFFFLVFLAAGPPAKKVPNAPVQLQTTVPVNPVPNQPLGKLIITSPKPGDYLVAGREFAIQWSAQGYVPEKCV